MARKTQIAELPFPSWGGPRPGAGRPREKDRGVPHTRRPKLSRHNPLHITLKLQSGLPNLRRKPEYLAIRASFEAAKERFGFRLIQFVVMSNHLHLIVEAEDTLSLSRGLKGLAIRVAKALNRLWHRKGSVFRERFHAHVLATPLEVRRTLLYVLRNAAKRAGKRIDGLRWLAVDFFSSGPWFDGWAETSYGLEASPFGTALQACTVAAARTWLLRMGWRIHGLIGPTEVPTGR